MTLLLTFPTMFSLGQTYDSVKVSGELNGDIYIICKNGRHGIHFKEDSLNNCTLTKTYQTDHTGIYYTKEFNLYGQLREEGFTKAVWHNRKFLGIKLKSTTYSLVKDGQWKFYDNNGYKTSDCCYHNGQICSCLWTNYDDKGNKTGEYWIDH